MDLASLQKQLSQHHNSPPPVAKWNPEFCGDIDMEIKHNGQWFYMGTPIGREALVKLFASVLKKENSQYFLVTPVEKVGIKVQDVPFVVIGWQRREGFLLMTTNTGDQVVVSQANPITLQPDRCTGDTLPYLTVRAGLQARLHQNVFYQLAALGEEALFEGTQHLLLQSGDYRFSLGKL